MDPDNAFNKMLYTIMAAAAGSITALSLSKWKEMGGTEIALTLFVGASFAIFVAPWIANSWFGVPETDTRAIAAITYLSAAGSNILIPILIRKFSRTLGEEPTK